jgi:hypothetical protein
MVRETTTRKAMANMLKMPQHTPANSRISRVSRIRNVRRISRIGSVEVLVGLKGLDGLRLAGLS